MIPRLRFRIISFSWISFSLIRQVSLLRLHQPAKVCILEFHLRCCVEWTCCNVPSATKSPRSSRRPRTCWCNRTRSGIGTWRHEIRRHNHHCWSRLGHNPFFLLFLNSFRHLKAANQAEILSAASGAEMANVEQTKKIIPLFTREITFRQDVCDLGFLAPKMTELRETLQQDSSLASTLLWLFLHLNLVELFLPLLQNKLWNWNG